MEWFEGKIYGLTWKEFGRLEEARRVFKGPALPSGTKEDPFKRLAMLRLWAKKEGLIRGLSKWNYPKLGTPWS